MKNSFKELEELEMQNVSMDSVSIKNGISAEIGIMRYVSSVVEMFLPRILEICVGLGGGYSAAQENERPN